MAPMGQKCLACESFPLVCIQSYARRYRCPAPPPPAFARTHTQALDFKAGGLYTTAAGQTMKTWLRSSPGGSGILNGCLGNDISLRFTFPGSEGEPVTALECPDPRAQCPVRASYHLL